MHEISALYSEFLDPIGGGFGEMVTFRDVTGGTYANGKVTGETVTSITVPASPGGPTAYQIANGLAEASDLFLQIPGDALEAQGFDPSLRWQATIDGQTYSVVNAVPAGTTGSKTSWIFRLGGI